MNTSNRFAAALDTFAEEARERIADMEEILLRAEAGTSSEDDLHALFRCAHTIKGSGGLFGLDDVVRFTHVVENVLDRLRNGAIHFDSNLVTLLLESQDQIAALVGAALTGESNADLPLRSGQLIDRLKQWVPDASSPPGASAPLVKPDNRAGSVDYWHLSLRFAPSVFADGMDPMSFVNYLSKLGQLVHVETVLYELPDFDHADPEACYLGFEVALCSDAGKQELEQVFEFVADDATIRIFPPHTRIDEFIRLIESAENEGKRLGEMLVACGTLTENELNNALALQRTGTDGKLLGQILIEERAVAADVVDAAVLQQRRVDEKKAHEVKNVKVPSARLDALIDQVGELVIAGAGVYAQAGRGDRNAMLESASQLLALVESIRDMTLGLRMVPIGEVFSRFHRVVRDVSKELGKRIDLVITGAESELDKSMVEKLGDPLMHLIRNAIDHGIEPADVRASLGKPEHGTVRLNAYHESGTIVVEVIDDGRGLDPARIMAKAIEKGLLAPDATPSTQEIYRLILEPGFSTAEQITNLSGRGVGMDVVRSNVESMRGTLDIHSEPGQGTTMRICLPLTLAIIDGFHVSVGSSHFIVPLDMVVECVEMPAGMDRAEYMELRDEAVPFVNLRRLFGESGPVQARQRLVVARFGTRRIGLVVDRIHGKCQTVIKPLGPFFEKVPSVSGSTILGSGDVALIIDVAQLAHDVARREYQRTRTMGKATPATAS
jgi:two-component system, chemotaxis family, sensor kinase CheA